MKGLTDISGIRVGHLSDFDGLTGCTAILTETGAVAGADVRGAASGTEEFELFNPLNMTDRIHGVVLAGGSAFGLEAASGARRFLEHKGVGFQTRDARVPLVTCAILYDLGIGKSTARPTREMGEAAAVAANDKRVEEGGVGAGTGATVGKILGMDHAMKSGIGSFTVELATGVLVSALAAVNAFGDVIDPATGKVVAGARVSPTSRDFVNTAEQMKRTPKTASPLQNTTLVVVATNARLTKPGANKLAQLASIGVARTISPVWTMYDGDVVIGLSVGEKQADLNVLGVAAAEAVSNAILRAVRMAPTMGGVPGLKA